MMDPRLPVSRPPAEATYSYAAAGLARNNESFKTMLSKTHCRYCLCMMIGSALHNIILRQNDKDESEWHCGAGCVEDAQRGERKKINNLPRVWKYTQMHKKKKNAAAV